MQNPFTASDETIHTEYIPPVNQEWQGNTEGFWSKFARLPAKTQLKCVASVGLDGGDFLLSLFPGVGHVYEVISIGLCCAMWGKRGAWSALELVDVTNLVDGFVPTCSIIAWAAVREEMAGV